jgi:hypothetical protein
LAEHQAGRLSAKADGGDRSASSAFLHIESSHCEVDSQLAARNRGTVVVWRGFGCRLCPLRRRSILGG